MKFFMFLGFLGHTLGCLPGFSRIFTNKFKDLTKKKPAIRIFPPPGTEESWDDISNLPRR